MDTREAAQSAIATPTMIALLGDHEVWVRKEAVETLKKIAQGSGANAEAAKEALARTAKNDESAWIRDIAAK